MNKFRGTLGYVSYTEKIPGRWVPVITERTARGEVIRNNKRFEDSGNQNDNLRLTNRFSILADAYASQNFHNLAYILYRGQKWKVSDVTVEERRLVFSLGGVWNGPKQKT